MCVSVAWNHVPVTWLKRAVCNFYLQSSAVFWIKRKRRCSFFFFLFVSSVFLFPLNSHSFCSFTFCKSLSLWDMWLGDKIRIILLLNFGSVLYTIECRVMGGSLDKSSGGHSVQLPAQKLWGAVRLGYWGLYQAGLKTSKNGHRLCKPSGQPLPLPQYMEKPRFFAK